MAQLARGRLRDKIAELEKALTGRVQPHHRFLLAKQLAHIDFLDEKIADISAEIGHQLEQVDAPPVTWEQAVALLDTIPGINRPSAEAILAEIGLDMRQFPTDRDLAAWAGVTPGNHESAGKRYSGRTRKGNTSLKTDLIRVAWAAVRTQDTFLKARYHRLASRRGKR